MDGGDGEMQFRRKKSDEEIEFKMSSKFVKALAKFVTAVGAFATTISIALIYVIHHI
jgi:hypothetical protein